MLRFTASYTHDTCDLPLSRPASFADAQGKCPLNGHAALLPETLPANDTVSSHSLVKKLRSLVRLNHEESAAIKSLASNARRRSAGEIIFHQESRSDHLCVMLEGLAFRYKLLPSGGRQILGYLLPGDLCDVQLMVFDRLDYSLASLTDCQIAMVPVSRLTEVAADYPRIARALMLAAVLDQAILRQWLLNVRQRNALQRLAHFFCEMYWRANCIGGVGHDGSIALPIGQHALADTIGLTSVHVNRTLQSLRDRELISLRRRRLTILDHARLSHEAEFDGEYMRALQTGG